MTPRPFVITIPPSNGDPRFEVWLADGVFPGRHLASLLDRDVANDVCIQLAWHYRCPARTFEDQPETTRSR